MVSFNNTQSIPVLATDPDSPGHRLLMKKSHFYFAAKYNCVIFVMQTNNNNIMAFEYSSLLNEFSLHFPDLDFSKVDSGYNQVENILLEHVQEFTAEQWQVICDSKYSDLFQDGTPHVSWNTDRGSICRKLIFKEHPCKTWYETWSDVRVYSIQMKDCVLEIKVDEPRMWNSYSRTRYYLKVTDVFTPIPTHRAVILAIGSDTRAYIKDEFAGSLNDCEEWVSKTIEKNDHFKIMAI